MGFVDIPPSIFSLSNGLFILSMQPLISVSKENVFALSNQHFSYVMAVGEAGILEHYYYGAPISRPLDIGSSHQRVFRGCTIDFQGETFRSLNDTPQEYPTFGTSDFRFPAFHGRNADGNTVFQLRFKEHRITKDKAPLNSLPSARGGDSETLVITLEDPLYKLEVELFYTIYAHYGVLVRSSKFKNRSEAPIQLKHVFSTSLDLPAGGYEVLHLHGSWARELNEERMDMPTGRLVIESARGASSAAHSPFLAVLEKGANEDWGNVYATSLVYSGNFAISVETGEFENVRVLAGINAFDFGWQLEPGETFSTPEALHVYSGKGLRAMSHIWHDFVRNKISPPKFRHQPRPSYLNTWEACYFDVDEDKVLALADQANSIGVDMLVLDDGWFQGRNDDTSSLGDWTADRDRFPSGIPALAAQIKAKGLKFGIWFEPEMVSPKSQLFKTHPDWTLHLPGRAPSLGRNQLTLDLSRPEVTDYIFNQIDAILCCGDIDYVKWDMNRNMTEVGSASLPTNSKQDVSHRYMLGLYGLLDRLTTRYPDILFENCASGGNRFDLGMMCYMPQTWVSDMCDPIGRLDIIHGASYVFPLDVMAAYIGPSPNHQNGRVSSLKTRFLAGIFCGARGVSLNESDIAAYREELCEHVRFINDSSQDMVGGHFDRLIKNRNEVCWQFANTNRSRVYLAYFHILAAPNLPFRRAHMTGLDPLATYKLVDDGSLYQGDALMHKGLSMPYVSTDQRSRATRYMDKGDFSAHLFVFEKVS